MIKYALTCDGEHDFEGWFSASADYDEQLARDLLRCPICASLSVRKQIMAPAVSGARKSALNDRAAPETREMMREVAGAVRAHVETHFDYVGDQFAREARAIHEGRADQRGIYGEATPREVTALVADGVQVAPMPPAPPKKTELN